MIVNNNLFADLGTALKIENTTFPLLVIILLLISVSALNLMKLTILP